MLSYSKKSLFFYSFILLAYSFFLIQQAHNLACDFFWFDESGQFFISQGLNHDSPPYSERGNLLDVINSNAYYNQDPGGYSILMYLWSGVSHNNIWLRCLSFLFMIGTMTFSFLASYNILKSKKLAIISGLFCFTLIGGTQFYELRGYGMELCGIAAGTWLITWIHRHLSFDRIIVSSLILSFFATARYTMLVFSAIFGLLIIVEIVVSQNSVNRKLILTTAFSIPLLLTAVFTYVYAVRIQNANLNSLSYITYFPGIKKIIIFLIPACVLMLRYKSSSINGRILLIFFWTSNTIFIILGLLKILPWNFYGNKGAPFIWLLEFTFYCSFVPYLKKYLNEYSYWIASFAVIILASIITFKFNIIPQKNHEISDNILMTVRNSSDSIYVNRFGCPEIRFYFEYGRLKEYSQELGYPARFVFLNGTPHSFDTSEKIIENRNHRKKYFFEKMPENSVLLGTYLAEDSSYQDNFIKQKNYINIKIR